MTERNTSQIDIKHGRMRNFAGRSLRIFLIVLFWLLIWQLVYMLIGRDIVFSSPYQVFARISELVGETPFWRSTIRSLGRIGLGFIIGLTAGILLSILTVSNKWFAALLQPMLSMIRATPVSSFIILALIWMSSVRVVVFIVFLMVMPIFWANLTEGIKKTDKQLIEMARVFSFSRWRRIRLIYLPSISPFLISAATTGLGLGWKAGVAAEVLSTPDFSLGKALYESKIYLETRDLFAYTAVVIVLSMILEKVVVKALLMLQNLISHQGRQYSRYTRQLLGRRTLGR